MAKDEKERIVKKDIQMISDGIKSCYHKTIKPLMKEVGRYLLKLPKAYRREYSIFVVVVSLICILLAQGAKRFDWIYMVDGITEDDIIGKEIQYGNGSDQEFLGDFLTNYRYLSFGETDPEEIDPEAPMIALTFDDGPNPEYTRRILDALEANYAKATFFVVGTSAEKHPEMLQEILSSGCELGNHTYHHKDLTKLDLGDVINEVDRVNRIAIEVTGQGTTLIRPPYGAYNDDVLSVMEEPVILWDLDTLDWENRNAEAIVQRVLDNVSDGDIILMHDIYDSTAEAAEILIPKLKEMGYQMVTISEMAQYKEQTLELNKTITEIKR